MNWSPGTPKPRAHWWDIEVTWPSQLPVTNEETGEAQDALAECARHEGILPANETAHAFFGARRYAGDHPGSQILICCSGRGDKDMPILQNTLLKAKR